MIIRCNDSTEKVFYSYGGNLRATGFRVFWGQRWWWTKPPSNYFRMTDLDPEYKILITITNDYNQHPARQHGSYWMYCSTTYAEQ